VTSEEIVEEMAFERIEPQGSLHLEAVMGQVWAAIMNTHRDTDKKKEPFLPSDGMPALARALGAGPEAEAILVDDPDEQSALMAQFIFGKVPGGR